MAEIAQNVRLFNEAFKLAHALLTERGIVVVGPTAERLSLNIRALIKARDGDAAAIAKEAVKSMT